MESVTTVGQKGYYNYYHVKNRSETENGKAIKCWYDKDVSCSFRLFPDYEKQCVEI